MDRHRVRIWVVTFGPEEVCEELGDGQRGSNLSKFDESERGKGGISWPVGKNSRESDLTATQKNITKNAMNRNGISSHPTPLNTAKNPISIGSVTKKSVPMTSFRLGFFLFSSHLFEDGIADAME